MPADVLRYARLRKRGYSNPLDATRMVGRGRVQALTLVQDGPSEWQAQTPWRLFAAVWRRDSNHRPHVPEPICFTAVHLALTTADGEETIPEVLEVPLEFLSFRSRRRVDRRSNHVT